MSQSMDQLVKNLEALNENEEARQANARTQSVNEGFMFEGGDLGQTPMDTHDYVSPTGRSNDGPPLVGPSYFDRMTPADRVEFSEIMGRIDYAVIETKLLEQQANFLQCAQESEELIRWASGHNPTLKVRLITYQAKSGAWRFGASFGKFGVIDLGVDTAVLERLGYRFVIHHKRRYYDAGSGTVKLLSQREVSKEIAGGHEIAYHGRVAFEAFDTEPLSCGGETTCIIYAPASLVASPAGSAGYWSKGVATCADDDNFDRSIGRGLAMQRAFNTLNEVVQR